MLAEWTRLTFTFDTTFLDGKQPTANLSSTPPILTQHSRELHLHELMARLRKLQRQPRSPNLD